MRGILVRPVTVTSATAVAAALLAVAVLAGCGRTAVDRLPHGASPDAGTRPRVTGEALVLIAQVREPRSRAEQGSIQALITPPPNPYFRVARALGSGCDLIAEPPAVVPQLSAGPIAITGGPQPVTLKPERPVKRGELLYPGVLFPRVFRPGDTLVVRAPGDEVAGFDDRAAAPGRLAVTFPDSVSLRGFSRLSYSGPAGIVWVTLRATGMGGASAQIRCRLTTRGGAAGSFTFSRPVLAALPRGSRSVRVTAGLVTETVSHIGPGISHVVVADLAEANLALRP